MIKNKDILSIAINILSNHHYTPNGVIMHKKDYLKLYPFYIRWFKWIQIKLKRIDKDD